MDSGATEYTRLSLLCQAGLEMEEADRIEATTQARKDFGVQRGQLHQCRLWHSGPITLFADENLTPECELSAKEAPASPASKKVPVVNDPCINEAPTTAGAEATCSEEEHIVGPWDIGARISTKEFKEKKDECPHKSGLGKSSSKAEVAPPLAEVAAPLARRPAALRLFGSWLVEDTKLADVLLGKSKDGRQVARAERGELGPEGQEVLLSDIGNVQAEDSPKAEDPVSPQDGNGKKRKGKKQRTRDWEARVLEKQIEVEKNLAAARRKKSSSRPTTYRRRIDASKRSCSPCQHEREGIGHRAPVPAAGIPATPPQRSAKGTASTLQQASPGKASASMTSKHAMPKKTSTGRLEDTPPSLASPGEAATGLGTPKPSSMVSGFPAEMPAFTSFQSASDRYAKRPQQLQRSQSALSSPEAGWMRLEELFRGQYEDLRHRQAGETQALLNILEQAGRVRDGGGTADPSPLVKAWSFPPSLPGYQNRGSPGGSPSPGQTRGMEPPRHVACSQTSTGGYSAPWTFRPWC